MVKLMSALLLLTAFTLLGFNTALKYTQRKDLLVEFRDFLQKIKTEISYFKEPLPILLNRMIQETENEISHLVFSLTLSLEENPSDEFSKQWEKFTEEIYGNSPLKKEDVILLKKAGTFLGQSDIDGQKQHIDLLIKQLNDNIHDAAEEKKIKGNMYKKLGLAAGVVLAVLVI